MSHNYHVCTPMFVLTHTMIQVYQCWNVKQKIFNCQKWEDVYTSSQTFFIFSRNVVTWNRFEWIHNFLKKSIIYTKKTLLPAIDVLRTLKSSGEYQCTSTHCSAFTNTCIVNYIFVLLYLQFVHLLSIFNFVL